MAHHIRHYICRLLALFFLLITSLPVFAQEVTKASDVSTWIAPASWFIYAVIFIILGGSLVALLVIRAALGNSKWSIADALSEEAEISATKTDEHGVTTVIYDETKQPMMITEMRASSSRVIALMGMVVILLMFLGFGAFALYGFAKTGKMPDSIDEVVNFLVAGLTLFAPYFVNKFSAIFENLKSKKS